MSLKIRYVCSIDVIISSKMDCTGDISVLVVAILKLLLPNVRRRHPQEARIGDISMPGWVQIKSDVKYSG